VINIGYWMKAILVSYLAFTLVKNHELSYIQLAALLLFTALSILKERFSDTVYMTIALLALTCAAAAVDLRFSVLFAAVVYHFMLEKRYFGVAAAATGTVYFAYGDPMLPVYLILLLMCGLFGYVLARRKYELTQFTAALDIERRLRYELERTKAELLHSSKSIAEIAEVKERNRIARSIHDDIGHSLAGVLIQLQAAYKLHAVDSTKSMAIVQKSIDNLADSLDVVRKTVHNIKPVEKVGAEYLRKIVEAYPYCPVELKLTGDFNSVPAAHLEVISTNMKEALTNTARYSGATKVYIVIEENVKYTRLYIKDNGIGCARIHEGLGLSGMKERVRNMGGEVSISGNDGFLIVCFIPRSEGGEQIESADCG